ncbi:MAG TPA: tRNA (adenosine(37)-N6)-dimethylallyltransferase MiaA [Candidatus Eisenbacteria bacterium]|nr:tRNA (adenosine(37)-N6)-dimethylallyltransferase MiaA [Candidatus Eisenbacteria bacterium]
MSVSGSRSTSGSARRRPIVILGPTAAGKSEIALDLARRIDAEIVGADSRQIYRGLEIGTAAPSERDRAVAPHHLASFLAPDQVYSAGRYARDAGDALAGIAARERTAVVVGGSGLYLRALLEGLFEGPERDEGVRAALAERLEREGLDALRADLGRVDPEALAKIFPGDSVRVIRALEVHALTGRPISALRRERRRRGVSASLFGIRWTREKLAPRIASRIRDQLRDGFLEQARALAAAGLRENAPGLHTLGYRELLAHLRGTMPLEEAVETIALRTRQLAKRQETWFRRVEGVTWFDLESRDEFPEVARAIAEHARGRPDSA